MEGRVEIAFVGVTMDVKGSWRLGWGECFVRVGPCLRQRPELREDGEGTRDEEEGPVERVSATLYLWLACLREPEKGSERTCWDDGVDYGISFCSRSVAVLKVTGNRWIRWVMKLVWHRELTRYPAHWKHCCPCTHGTKPKSTVGRRCVTLLRCSLIHSGELHLTLWEDYRNNKDT